MCASSAIPAAPPGQNWHSLVRLQGDLVLRDGSYVSEHDAYMKVDGLYIAATGRLHAVLKPVDDVHLTLAQEDLDAHTADYRQAPYEPNRALCNAL